MISTSPLSIVGGLSIVYFRDRIDTHRPTDLLHIIISCSTAYLYYVNVCVRADVRMRAYGCTCVSGLSFYQVFQKRYDGEVNFTRNWTDYTNGFGWVFREYWWGE